MRKRAVFLLFTCLSIVIISNSITSSSNAQSSLRVLVVGDHLDNSLTNRIQLDPSFQVFHSEDVGTDVSSYDSILIFDYVPNTDEIVLLSSFSGGIGIFIYSNLASNATILETLGLATTTSGTVLQNNSLPIPATTSIPHPLLNNIQWNSVPTITNYTSIQLDGTILVATSSDSSDPDLALISTADNHRLIAFNFFPDIVFNTELVEWPFFNYLLYSTMMSISGEEVLKYAKWDFSPVPHSTETIVLGVSVFLTIVITFVGFRYAKKHT